MTLPQYNRQGVKEKPIQVDAAIFSIAKPNHNLVKTTYENYLHKKRVNLAKTKNRSQVRGGGRKPRPQKGSGRSRQGTIRSPIWRGGGIVFGPTGLENYKRKINKKAKALALRQALTLKSSRTLVIEDLPNDGKTATLAKLIQTLKLNRKILIVDAQPAAEIKRATRNLSEVQLLSLDYLNVFRVINADWLLFTQSALENLQAKPAGEEG